MILVKLSVFNLGTIPSIPSIFYISDIIFLIVLILIIGAMLFMMFIYVPKKVQEFKSKREDLLNSLKIKVPGQKKEVERKLASNVIKKMI
jgi:hypothetical protein